MVDIPPAQWPSVMRVVGRFLTVLIRQRVTDSGTGFGFGVICHLSAVIGVVSARWIGASKLPRWKRDKILW